MDTYGIPADQIAEICRQIDYDRMPMPHMAFGLRKYIENGLHPGSFLVALLKNDLKETIQRADSENRRLLPEWVLFVTNHLPPMIHGSPEAVNRWIDHRGIKGLLAGDLEAGFDGTHGEDDDLLYDN
jgi:hypothetical protein